MFNIEVSEGNPKISPLDERIAVTVFSIFQAFFLNRENVAIYVCESIDNRHLARKRKFDQWFGKYNDGTLNRHDNVAIVAGAEMHNSVILHVNNASMKEIIQAYEDLHRSVNKSE
jgi:hypothetical protein